MEPVERLKDRVDDIAKIFLILIIASVIMGIQNGWSFEVFWATYQSLANSLSTKLSLVYAVVIGGIVYVFNLVRWVGLIVQRMLAILLAIVGILLAADYLVPAFSINSVIELLPLII